MKILIKRLWRTINGRDDAFFALLQAGADEARTSVGLLSAYLHAQCNGKPGQPDALAESRRRQKQIRAQTIRELNRTLTTPFDREDIQALAFALYRIPKIVEKVVERIGIYPGDVPCASFLRQAELLTIAADAVVHMVRQLPSGADIEKVSAANARLQLAEGEADKIMLGLRQELYSGPYAPKELVILQGLYELVERAVDRCRDAGNIVLQIALKGA